MTLIQLFTSIANAIRAKTGSSETIVAEDFPTEIAGITTGNLTNEEYSEANDDLDDILENTTVPSGTINITENGSYDVTNYLSANVNVSGGNNNARINEDVANVVGEADSDGAFYVSRLILELPELNMTNVTNISYMFENYNNLTTISLINTSDIVNMSYAFGSCSNLVNLSIGNVSNITNMSGAFDSCENLSNESLNNILAMCASVSSEYEEIKTLMDIGLNEDQATVCISLSNWATAKLAGWETGYYIEGE